MPKKIARMQKNRGGATAGIKSIPVPRYLKALNIQLNIQMALYGGSRCAAKRSARPRLIVIGDKMPLIAQ
jgi:hypothetical protein